MWASKPTPFAPLPYFHPLACESKWIFFHSASRGGTWDVEWWTGEWPLCCFALHWRRSMICISVVPHSQTRTHPSTSYCSTPMTAPPPTWQPTSQLLIKEGMFISLPVFYKGGVLSLVSGTTSPGLTWEGKLSRCYTGFTSLLRWCQNHITLPSLYIWMH